jgi:hypothetical protein
MFGITMHFSTADKPSRSVAIVIRYFQALLPLPLRPVLLFLCYIFYASNFFIVTALSPP